MEYLKILIFNYPSVKRPNKKPRIHNFTIERAFFFFFFFFFFPICKKHQYPFLSLLFSSLLNFFSFPPCSSMYSSPFFFFLLSFF